MTIRALIFDFDGLILDSEYIEFQVWQEIFQSFKAQLPLQEWVKCVGTSLDAFDPFEYLQAQIHFPLDLMQIRSQQDRNVAVLIEKEPPLPGVAELLQAARSAGIKIAVASSSSRQWVEGHLTRLGLLHYFDVVCTSENVEKVKPDPALFLCALKKLDVSAGEAVIFEDSLNGLTAARAAGIFCVIVPNRITSGLDFSNAGMILPSLADVSFALLENKIG